MLPQWIIEKKRDGQALSDEEIAWFIDGYTSGDIPDYQMAALAMAIFFRDMNAEETATLTAAMMNSGSIVDTSRITLPKIDKHSTGGIGDKVSLVLAPLVASCGIAVPMISGRGLGITGGTLDKLESIPGYRCNLSEHEFLEVVGSCGCSIIGQTAELAPADKKLYALRDVTGTVASIPLIVGSILCKKLAEGIDGLVLDVKFGKGAFMHSLEDARDLANRMVSVGTQMGKRVSALITDMNQPLGRTVGNALEVIEVVETLQGNGPTDLVELTLALAEEMLFLAEITDSKKVARGLLLEKLENGDAFAVFLKMVELQGGDSSFLQSTGNFSRASIREVITARDKGIVCEVDAEAVGRAVVLLGGGRVQIEDSIDHAVGISALAKCGESVNSGDALCIIHANEPDKLASAKAELQNAFLLAESMRQSPPLIYETTRTPT